MRYELKAYVSHIGYSLDQGHFLLCYKSTDQWHLLDDDKEIKALTESENQRMIQQAYYLVYVRENTQLRSSLKRKTSLDSEKLLSFLRTDTNAGTCDTKYYEAEINKYKIVVCELVNYINKESQNGFANLIAQHADQTVDTQRHK